MSAQNLPSTSAAATAETSWAVFRHRDFACYCSSRFVSALAIQMQNVAVGWRVYDLTGDPLAL
ncbi:MAG: MFS transporter, partial [Geminicoccaceae bacterium]